MKRKCMINAKTESEVTMKEALEENLKLIIVNACDLEKIFREKEDVLYTIRAKQMKEFFIAASVTLIRLQDGKLDGKEQALFDAFMPTCAFLNQQWHKYNK